MELTLQKNYKWTLNATLQNTSVGEIEIKLSIAPLSDLGFITIEPWVNGKEETIFYHRKVWTSVFVYGVNRDNPLQHIVDSAIILANSIDVFNILLDEEQAPYIFKKSTSDVIIKGGKFYINNVLITIADVDTSVPLENKVLDPNDTNYVYIKNNDYFISQAYDATLYPVCDIIVDAGWNITSITKHKFKDLLNASGYAPLDELWKIPFQYLPAVFAAIEEYSTLWNFPVVWEPWILYVVTGESLSYRWDWDSYVAMTGIWDMFSGNNLSELTNMQVARDNLNVYSQIEMDTELDLKVDKAQLFEVWEDLIQWNVFYLASDNKVYKADSWYKSKMDFKWIATESKIVWEFIKWNIDQISNNHTWLTAGLDYYLDSSLEWWVAWWITTSLRKNRVYIWKAISTTWIDMNNILSLYWLRNIFKVPTWSKIDWNVTISVNTTLTKDMYYDNLTINTWIVLNPDWYKIFVWWTLINNWTIRRNWNNWWNGTWNWTFTIGWIWATVLNAWTLWNIPTYASWWNWWTAFGLWSVWWVWINYNSYSNSNWVTGWQWWGNTNPVAVAWVSNQIPVFQWGNDLILLYITLWLIDLVTIKSNWTASWWNWWKSYQSWWTEAWWAGWWAWWDWGVIFISANIIQTLWVIESIWWNGWNGWSPYTNWWGGWWWWAWNWWVVILLSNTYINTSTINISWWTWWLLSNWDSWRPNWTNWSNWNPWIIITNF